ncbi:pirin family protein [Rhodococcus pyridinivorans]|uniref:Pirin-like protein n=1 Tax=Rhodococcus pyridinivorans AK37 TaxID=1114960 RepID=H0JP76_9NOCA|nr:pirin family protein [Rhodococcus pyridinivorans]AWZ24956.1 pirin family protein [Rhodococcus pyridinivorans]EHK84652.1 pirin-like protein [Rhodococcus pyridinivorans AK37]MCD2140035.1 pirin family protein [Rhodococcus pyridinivorans]
MSNTDTRPEEIRCRTEDLHIRDPLRPRVEIITSREVPLGGPRAMPVRRTLPQRQRSLIGAWCFVDHYGPDDVSRTGGMDVAPHPHTGLQTVSWLFTGEIEHRDSHGVHAMVRPGELNLMTGGHGICHSEVSTSATTTLHGVQLWVALPDAHRDAPRDFQHHVPPVVRVPGAEVKVFLGSLAGEESPVTTYTPLLGAEIVLDPAASITLDVDPSFEHGVLVDTGTVALFGTVLTRAALGYTGTGVPALELTNTTDEPARIVLLGGTPLGEEIVMWWNFVGRDHDEIVAYRDAWERGCDRFGRVSGYTGRVERLPAPPLPQARIRPRRNPPTADPNCPTQDPA